MKNLVLIAALALSTVAFAKGKEGCTFSNMEKLKTHSSTHITYPAKGKVVKAACRKEMPDEFTKDELACIDSKIKDNTEYKSEADVLSALGVKQEAPAAK